MKRKTMGRHPPRNPYHDHPLLKKGGVHDKTGKAKRRNAKLRLRREWDDRSMADAA